MIDDESKKFIKETIENAIDDKLSEHDKKTESQKKLDSINYQKKELEDRKKLLAELSERDKKGQATIAEKFEKLKLSVDTSIPQDLKDAWKTGSKGVQAGANQVGKGIGHLTVRAMMSNPLTAFLYQNRDIAGAIGDIGIGSIKAGWGALKGLGHGALGLANSAKNLFNRDEEEETEEILNLPKPSFNGNSQAEKLVKEKSNWEKQINEMHTIITQDLTKNQKKSSEIMGKGLKGLDDNMKAIKGFTDMMATKQKLILGGIMLGAAAIIGLVAWFKSGGWDKIKPKDWGKDNINHDYTPMQNSVDVSVLKNDEFKDYLDKNKKNFTGVSDTTSYTTKVKDPNSQSGAMKNQTTYQYKAGNLTKILAPIAGTINKLKDKTGSLNGGETRTYYEFLLYGQVDKSASGLVNKYVTYKFENILNPKVYDGLYVEKKQLLGFADGSFKITQVQGDEEKGGDVLKNYQSFINKEKETGWAESDKITTDRISEKDNQKTVDNLSKLQRIHESELDATEAKNNGFKNVWNRIKNTTHSIDDEANRQYLKDVSSGKNPYEKTEQTEEGTITGGAAPTVSTNIKKAQEQNKKLNEKKEEPKTEQGTPQGQGYVGQLPPLTFKSKDTSQPYQYADLRPTGDIPLMISDMTTNIGAIGG